MYKRDMNRIQAPGPRGWLAMGLVLAAGLVLVWSARSRPEVAAPVVGPRASYVPAEACYRCHEKERAAWADSDHAHAMKPATAANVLADFEDARLEVHGVPWRFFRKDGRPFVATQGPEGAPVEHEVLYTFGVDPLQQYLVDVGRGRLQSLTACWDPKAKRWFPLYDEPLAPGDPLHWAGPLNNANFMCIECHVTDFQRGYDADGDVYRSTWSELGVGCQACHGPGSAHVAFEEKAEREGNAPSLPSDHRRGLVVRLKDALPDVEVDTCARCHARRSHVAPDYLNERAFLDQYEPDLPLEPLYHADGQIREEVYEYGSFLQSKMHVKGVRCSDCHDAHGARLKRPGDATCTECHREDPPARWATLPRRRYDDRSHHHHETGKPGSFCVDCHMAPTTYMGVDPRRDHSFRIPRPELTLRYGVPNACDRCHADKGAAWSANHQRAWFPAGGPTDAQIVLCEVSRGGAVPPPQAVEGLVDVAGQGVLAPVTRASAVALLGGFRTTESLEAALTALENPEPMLRLAAVNALGQLLPAGAEVPQSLRRKEAAALVPRFADAVRAVRVEAARVASQIPPAAIPPGARAAFDAALAEYRARLESLRDRPDASMNLGILAENQGRPVEAEAHYRETIRRFGAYAVPARLNLAQLLHGLGRSDAAEEVLRGATELSGREMYGEAQYSLGLLLAERGRLPEAVDALQQAAERLPRARVLYNLGLALREAGDVARARAVLERAASLDPSDPDIAAALR